MTSNSIWKSGISTSGVLILESTAKPITTHKLRTVMWSGAMILNEYCIQWQVTEIVNSKWVLICWYIWHNATIKCSVTRLEIGSFDNFEVWSYHLKSVLTWLHRSNLPRVPLKSAGIDWIMFLAVFNIPSFFSFPLSYLTYKSDQFGGNVLDASDLDKEQLTTCHTRCPNCVCVKQNPNATTLLLKYMIHCHSNALKFICKSRHKAREDQGVLEGHLLQGVLRTLQGRLYLCPCLWPLATSSLPHLPWMYFLLSSLFSDIQGLRMSVNLLHPALRKSTSSPFGTLIVAVDQNFHPSIDHYKSQTLVCLGCRA